MCIYKYDTTHKHNISALFKFYQWYSKYIATLQISRHFPVYEKNIFSNNSNVHAKLLNSIVEQCLKPAFIEGGRASIRAALTT